MKKNPHPTQQKTARKVLEGSAGMRDSTVKMKRVLKGKGVVENLGPVVGVAQRDAILAKLQETDDTHGDGRSTVPLEIEKMAIVDIAGGASPAQVAVKYDIQAGYVQHALRRRFGSPQAAMQALQGLVLENALACQIVAATQIDTMSGPQAVMSGAILIDKALAISKNIAETPKSIDFSALADIGDTLRTVRSVLDAKP
jgi:hypothetical protein